MDTKLNGHEGPKRAIAYARVSTKDQKDNGYSLDTQLKACRLYAEQHGLTVAVADEFTEDYSGKTPIADRPAGKRVAEMLRTRAADALIVYAVDRLSCDIVDVLASVQVWTRAGIEIHACDMGRIKDERDIVLVIKGWQGDDGSQKIRTGCTRGRRGKVESGKVVGTNRSPYGYKFTRDDSPKRKVKGLEPLEEQAQVVRQIFHWFLDERASMLRISQRLHQMGTPTPGGDVYKQAGRSGKPRSRGIWSPASVRCIIENEVYAGAWHFRSRYLQSLDAVAPHAVTDHAVKVPALVSHEEWERAQALKAQRKCVNKHNRDHDFLLRRLLKCGCGLSMNGRAGGRGIGRYRCRGVGRGVLDTCDAPTVSADLLDPLVWEGLKGFFSDLKRLARELKIAQQAELDAQEPKRQQLAAVVANILQAKRDADKLSDALLKASGVVEQSLQEKMDECNQRHDALSKRKAELEEQLSHRQLTDEAVSSILTYARDVRLGLENATPTDRRRALEILDVEVTVRGSKYEAKCVLGSWEGQAPLERLDKNSFSRATLTSTTRCWSRSARVFAPSARRAVTNVRSTNSA